MPSLRIERVRELLRRSLGELIRREFPISEVGLLNVNEVEVTGDFKQATAYVGIVGSVEQKRRAVEALQKNRVKLQNMLSQDVILRHTPQLKLVIDDSIEKGNRVLAIMDELERGPSGS